MEDSSSHSSNTSPSSGSTEGSPASVDDILSKGTAALQIENYEEAIYWFKDALDITLKRHGDRSIECISPYHLYGCALLVYGRKLPSSNDTKNHDVSGPSREQQNRVLLQQALDKLKSAWDIATDNDIIDVDLRVDILRALGETEQQRGNFEDSFSYYTKALSILEPVQNDSRKFAAICRSTSHCLYNTGRPREALYYCIKCINIDNSWIGRLINEPGNGDANKFLTLHQDRLAEMEPLRNALVSELSAPRPPSN